MKILYTQYKYGWWLFINALLSAAVFFYMCGFSPSYAKQQNKTKNNFNKQKVVVKKTPVKKTPQESYQESAKSTLNGFEMYDDTVATAKGANFDYVGIVKSCIKKDEKQMHMFFTLSQKANFDGASAEGHSSVTFALFITLGDDFFGGCLSKEKKDIQDCVRMFLLFEFDYYDNHRILKKLKKNYPKTFPKKWKVPK